MFEVIPAFVGRVEVADAANGVPKGLNGPGFDPPEMCLELGKGHFDGIEIGTVRRQEQESCSALFQQGRRLLAFVTG